MQFVLSKSMFEGGVHFSAVFSFLECPFDGHSGFTCL